MYVVEAQNKLDCKRAEAQKNKWIIEGHVLENKMGQAHVARQN